MLLMCSVSACKDNDDKNHDNDNKEQQVKELLEKVGATKIMNAYDEENCVVYTIEPGSNSPQATIKKSVYRNDIKEGTGAFRIEYTFAAKANTPAPEYVSLQQLWGDYRSDLSFHPLGISLNVKGKQENKGSLRFILIQNETTSTSEDKRQYFQYVDKDILSREGWQRLVIPYSFFSLYKGLTGSDTLNLARIIGYRIDIVNDKNESASGEILIDGLEQLTSYKPEYGTPKFTSLFIQLNKVYENADWDTHFKDCKEIGIDTWIIQYSQGFGGENNISWYSGTNAPWNEVQYTIIDDMVKAAERQNFKLIFGLYGGDYSSTNLNDPAQYDLLYDRNKIVLDELYEKFADSACFAGWYITEEFHDGTYPLGWHNDPARTLLAEYLQNVAAYAKAKPKKFSVQIAPALWRGMPADKCGEWFKSIFEKTPDVDFLYLQDVGGRCLTDTDVDLPNYFRYIKQACDETGVEFGVDIESFLSCWCPDVPYRSKNWAELEEQLYVAGLFTTHITNFSWATFKPGLDSFEGYKNYLKKNNLLK